MLDSMKEAPEMAECIPMLLHLHSAGNHQHKCGGQEDFKLLLPQFYAATRDNPTC